MKVWAFSLSGTALNWAVEMVECEGAMYSGRECRPFSTDWAVGGPIIEKQEIALEPMTDSDYGDGWLATLANGSAVCMEFGPTMLVAAMRCYVLSRLGDEIEVPDEMCKTKMEVAE